MTEPVWLNPEQLIEMNRNLVADTGETFFVRDLALLESAAERTAFMGMVLFFGFNGYELNLSDTDYLGRCVERVIEKTMSETEFLAIVSEFAEPSSN